MLKIIDRKIKLDVIQWKKFNLKDLFTITGSKSFTKKQISEYGIGKYPYVVTSSENNGIQGFYNHFTEKGGILTIDSATVGSCFYQPLNFSASDHVEKLIPKFHINTYIAIFIQTIIGYEKFRYGFGRKFAQMRIKETKIKLPATPQGEPDWQFMEDYIKSLLCTSIKKIKKNPLLKENKNLQDKEWKSFKIGMLFIVEKCKCSNASELLEDGDSIFYIGAKKYNNGIMNKVKADKNLTTKGDCLIFICDGQGSVGYSNYIDIDFIGSTTLSVGYNRNLNKYNGLFLVTLLDLERDKYSFGRKWNGNRLKNTKIKLPATPQGEPDWQFMEDYIKSLPYSSNL